MTPPKEFFTESDCDVWPSRYDQRPSGISIARANQLIRERSRVVYGRVDSTSGWFANAEDPAYLKRTHQALLINIEPIAQPDSAEKIIADLAELTNYSIEYKPAINPLLKKDLGAMIERARRLLERKDGV